MKQFKARCHYLHDLINGFAKGLTDKQQEELSYLLSKPKLTENQSKKLADLQAKQSSKELSQTAKSKLIHIKAEELYGKRKIVESKYLDKGIENEQEAIDYASKVLGWGDTYKNTQRFDNEYLTGEPDIIKGDTIIDIKNSWDFSTFPLFKQKVNPVYYWQGQGYMYLTGATNFKVVYVLTNTPERIVTKEAYNISYSRGYTELNEFVYEELMEYHNYDNVPDELRIKVFDFERNEEHISLIPECIEACRKYLNNLKIN